MSEIKRSYDGVVDDTRRYYLSPEIGAAAMHAACSLALNDHDADITEMSIVQSLENLRASIAYPFNQKGRESIVSLFWDVTQQLNPVLGSYDLVVGDEVSGILPAVLFWRLVNLRRETLGLPPAEIGFMNGKYPYPAPNTTFPAGSSYTSRALVVTEFADTGISAKNIQRSVMAARGRTGVDVVALAAHNDVQSNYWSYNFYYPRVQDVGTVNRYLHGSQAITGRRKGKYDLHSSRVPDEARKESQIQRAYEDVQNIAFAFHGLLSVIKPCTASEETIT